MKNSFWNQQTLSWWNELLKGIDIMYRAHWKDARKNDGSPYLVHQFQIISDYIDKYNANLHDILVFLLHDVIEDHSEYWKEIYTNFWLQTFRDVLILSTGWFSFEQRREMLQFFTDELHDHVISCRPWDIIHDIIQILSPEPPLKKLKKHSIYAEKGQQYELSAIKKAIRYYAIRLLNISPDEDTINTDEEYLWLWNYIYMNRNDVFRKLQDMLNNMKDMREMEKKKPWYINKRHIKAYILMVKMRNFWMENEISDLLIAFQESWHPLIEAKIEARMNSL